MQKDFDAWNKRKKEIHKGMQGDNFPAVHQRDIWWCSIGLNIGDEQDGRNADFERPVLVLKRFNRKIVLGVPLTSMPKDNPYYFSFTFQNVVFVALLSQLRLLSTVRFTRRMTRIERSLFTQIMEQIRKVIF